MDDEIDVFQKRVRGQPSQPYCQGRQFPSVPNFSPWTKTSVLKRHGPDEIVPLDFQHPFDGVGLEFSIHVKDLFHDLCVFFR